MSFQNKKNSDDIKTNKEKSFAKEESSSSISEFIRRPLPTGEEVEKFEKQILERSKQEKEETIKNSLSEIYQDETGNMVNVKKIEKKKKRGIITWFFSFLFFTLILLASGMGVYYFAFISGGASIDVEFSISGKEQVMVNEEFVYEINYKNLTNTDLNNVRIEVRYPDNFILLSSEPEISTQNAGKDVWQIDKINPGESGRIEITGKMIGLEKESGIILAEINYTPSNFSSEFQKDSSLNTQIKGVGLDFNFDTRANVLVGETENLKIEINPQAENFLDDFLLNIEKPDHMEILELKAELGSNSSEIIMEENEEGFWSFSDFNNQLILIDVEYKFLEKTQDTEKIKFVFEKEENQKKFSFFNQEIQMDIMRSNLDLSLIINASQQDQPVNFGEKLNYSISYTNKGEATMENVMIMLVLDSEFLDWTSLETNENPSEKGYTLTWTKEEISKLENLGVGDGGVIDFSINVMPFTKVEDGRDYRIRSYAQFVTDNSEASLDEDVSEAKDNRSNIIINQINSDLALNEEIRYFSEDNIPVGTGPLPPKVDEETTFKVYWTVKNNLHELRDTKVSLDLPKYLEWHDKTRTSVGNIDYQEENHQVIWTIGRLPLVVYRADAEFSISLTPSEEDENKILILSPGATVEAFDTQTNVTITDSVNPKTTKLEDDSIADMSSDGRIVK